MNGIKILGAQGSTSIASKTTCIQVNKDTLIDAGNIMQSLGSDAININNIFLSHAHLDHVMDLAFLMDNFFSQREIPLRIYGLKMTIEALRKHLFNWDIWPDFSSLHLPGTTYPSVEFIPIELDRKYHLQEDVTLTPVKAVHTVPCCGYIIQKKESAIYFTADTFQDPNIWDRINNKQSIKALIIDVSFPNELKAVAVQSKHLTPQLLKQELEQLNTKELHVYINHIKPAYKKTITKQLQHIGISAENILQDGEFISFQGKLTRKSDTIHNKINKLNSIGIALSAEENQDALMERIITEAKELTGADGGTLYLLEDRHLHFSVVQTDSLGISMGGVSGAITWTPLALYKEDGTPNTQMVAVMCALEEKVINIPDVYEAKGFFFDGTKKFDASTGYRSKSMLVIPLRDHEHKVIGVLQLLNKTNPLDNSIQSFNKEDEDITLSLGSQAAVAITNVKLIDGLETLLECFLKSIIYAIEKKSPYTAGHIKRMVELSVLLAKSINKDSSFFQGKSFTDEEIKQINFAALMHDIGKLATPEQVMDKGKKLECIFDRLELVQKRIELIQSLLEVELLKGAIDEEFYKKEYQKLSEYKEIIEKSNRGSEFFSDEEVTLIKEIKEKRYKFNQKEYFILTEDEAYNLSVQKGTLTEEERNIINEHAKISVDILDQLPFPEKYKEIPQISGNHHEKINGKGYPKGLKEDEISFEARILAVADIFEALTASDRPYKKANPLSVAMKILYFMAKDGELDKDLVKYFYTSGLHLEYAKKFLPPSSIDEVHVDFSSL